MKLITIFGAGLLAFSGSFALSNNIFATEATEIVAPKITEAPKSTKPSRAELSSAISRIENLKNYHEYFYKYSFAERFAAAVEDYRAHPGSHNVITSTAEFEAATKFHAHYAHLFDVVAQLKALEADYETASPNHLSVVIAEAKDSARACELEFNAADKTYTKTPTVSSANPATPVPTPTVATVASKPTVAPATTPTTVIATQITPSESPSNNTIETTEPKPATDDNIAIPATGNIVENTGEAEKSNKPFFITLSAVALACLLIGSMLILNRKKSYRPGRKF